MPDLEVPSGSLVVATNKGNYYVIPPAALEQFRATPEQKEQIDEDEEVTSKVHGTFAPLDADEASAEPSFASEPETSALAWFHKG
jgi:hypothetical protein